MHVVASTPKPTEVHVRLPADVITKLKEAARENDRSMNAEIRSRLRASFETYRV